MKIRIEHVAHLLRQAAIYARADEEKARREATSERVDETTMTARLVADAVLAEREACAQAALRAIEQCSIKPVSMSEIGKCVLSAIRSGG